ncbi:MAG: TetR/AcrR family transcriptional regulator [Deltaproteobacteria bacterium HGW-Deltaproteobacteria-8]|jgi:AcrR family transcriptional regulator|nr:MAG: TetR/AcrR family transcriptional regulator [Deltaproteobacteria bacterium HGW-Deltaproteobacteria-8]
MDTPSPTPRPAPRSDLDSAPGSTFNNLDPQKQRRVLDESLREFAENGYHQASINRIVGRLDIAKGSLFQYFGSKEGLFRHLFRRAVDEIKAPLRAIRDADSAEAFPQRLKRVFTASAAFAQAHPFLWGIYRRMLTQEDFPLRATLLSEVRAEALTFFRELVELGQKQGSVRADLNPAIAAFVIEATLDRALTAQGSPLLDAGLGLSSDPNTRQARLDALAEALCQGFSVRSVPSIAKGDVNA